MDQIIKIKKRYKDTNAIRLPQRGMYIVTKDKRLEYVFKRPKDSVLWDGKKYPDVISCNLQYA